MAHRFALLFLFAIYVVAAPTPRFNHQHTTSSRVADTSSTSYIVSFKPNTVNPDARGTWLNGVLASNGLNRTTTTDSNLRLNWNETVFDGLAGTFSDAELQTLTARDEVKYVQPGEFESVE